MDWLDGLARSAAVLGAFVAVGQTASKAIESHYQQNIEEAKARADIQISKEKSESGLASDFLRIILAKETSERDRKLVLDALRSLPSHPLQKWAESRYIASEALLAAMERAQKARLGALSEQDPERRQTADLTAQIALLDVEVQLYKDDPTKSEELRGRQIVVTQQLALVIKGNAAARTVGTVPAAAPITAMSSFFGVPLSKIKDEFGNRATGDRREQVKKNIDAWLPPLEACMRESGFTDDQTVSQIFAQIAHETVGFQTLEEFATGDAYEDRRDLGNVQPGDGRRFKSRGLLGITGRSNYLNIGRQIGLGTRLVDSPEDAMIPATAAQIACFYFGALGERFRNAAKNEDTVRVRELVNGGHSGLDAVKLERLKILAMLREASSSK
jgi:predicted chitinase